MGKSMTRTDLTESAQTLLQATRDAYEPSASNRAHVRWRVDRALASNGTLVAGGRARRVARIASLSAAAVVAVGAAAALTWRGVQPQESAAPMMAPSKAAAEDPAQRKPLGTQQSTPTDPAKDGEKDQPDPPTSSESTGAKRVGPGSRSPRTARGDLSGEVALIARAQSATNRGEAEKALEALKEYDRKHPGGELTEERSAARILALCAAGRRKEARGAAARFLARWPRSPQAARIQSSCAR